MADATARNDLIPVYSSETDPETGHRHLNIQMLGDFDYDEVKKLPRVLEYDGDIFVRTGWNSDVGRVYYRNHLPVAKEKP